MSAADSRRETSYGIIPLKFLRGSWRILLIQHGAGHWAFPKGHPELGEHPKQTAERELLEETGLRIVNWMDMPSLQEDYCFRQGKYLIFKTVVYYVAKVSGRVKLMQEEISDSRWIKAEEAAEYATFPEGKRICKQVAEVLSLQQF